MARLFRRHPHAHRQTSAISRSLRFSLDELRYEYPDELREGSRRRRRRSRLSPGGRSAPLSRKASRRRSTRRSLANSSSIATSINIAPYFLTVHDIVRLRARQRHPLPGARLGGQFRRLLLPRHHRGRSRQHRSPVRALRLDRAQRAARHRRRFRARAARGGDPVHLRRNTAATAPAWPRRVDHLSRAAARSAKSARRFGLSDDTIGALCRHGLGLVVGTASTRST